MQARLRSDRIFAACVASLPYWEKELEKCEAKRQAYIEQEIQPLLKKKTWCGGYQFNEASARALIEEGYWDSPYLRPRYTYEGEKKGIEEAISTVKKLMLRTEKPSKPYPVLLSDYEFGLIWDEV